MGKFADFLEAYEPLQLPIGGKTYTIPPVTLADGARFKLVLTNAEGAEFFSDAEFEAMLVGPALKAEMVADGVSDVAFERVLLTALADHQQGREAAEVMWATGGDPKALKQYVREHAPNRAQRRSKSSGGAAKTRTPGSTSGTKPHPDSSPNQATPSTGS